MLFRFAGICEYHHGYAHNAFYYARGRCRRGCSYPASSSDNMDTQRRDWHDWPYRIRMVEWVSRILRQTLILLSNVCKDKVCFYPIRTDLDGQCKKWRLFADILNDLAMGIELLLPYFSSYSLVILCISTAMKSIVGVAGGATRAALTQHQVRRT